MRRSRLYILLILTFSGICLGYTGHRYGLSSTVLRHFISRQNVIDREESRFASWVDFVLFEPSPPTDRPKTENPLLQTVNCFSKTLDLEEMKNLLQLGEPINVLAKDEYGFTETPLTKAIKRIAPAQSNPTNVRHGESTEVIRLLLDHGANPNMPNGDGVPPLFIAASQGDVPTMELLIAKGARTDKLNKNQYGQETGLVEATAGSPYSQNAFLYLLDKHVSFDPDAVLKKLCWNDCNDEEVRALLAYPVTFSDTALEQLETRARGTVLNIVGLARKHNQIVQVAQSAKRSPQLMFNPIKPIVHQIDPPVSDGPLVQAIGKKDFATVKALIESGADDVNSITSRQSLLNLNSSHLVAQPALNLSIIMGSQDIAMYLLDHGADPDLTDGGDHGDSPLALAVRANDSKLVQKLITKGANVNRQIWNIALTPLAEVRSADVAKLLIEAGADPNLAETMHRIVTSKDTDVVRYVLSRGGRLDQASMKDGNTPLHNLFQDSYTSAPDPAYVQFLVDNGAPLDALNFQKQTPYDLAVVHKFDKIVELLAQKGGNIGDPETALFNALVQDDVITAKHALNILGQIKNKNVLLGLTNYNTKHISIEMLDLLTAHGADYTQDFGEHATLLHMIQNPEVIKYLIKHGANVDAEGRNHDTPLHAMVRAHNVEAVLTLLNYKAFPNTRDGHGATPLCLALQGPQDMRLVDGPPVDWHKAPKPYLEIIKLLARAGADPNMLDEKECQPWGDDPEYRHYRKEAEAILAENAAPIAIRVLQKKQGRFVEMPYSATNTLFWLVRDSTLHNQSSQPVHPVLQAAQTLYQHYPNSAADFSDFIRRLRFHPEDTALTWRSGGDVGLQQDSGETLLHTAAYYGDLRLAEQLINIIGSQRLVDKQGKIPLFYAANSYGLVGVEKALQMVDLLRNQGGENINDSDHYGNSPLLVSGGVSFKGDSPTDQYQMIRGLLNSGADPAMGASTRNVADIAQEGKKSAIEYKREVAARAYQSLLDDLAKQNILPEQRNDKTNFDRDNPFYMAVASLNISTAKRLMSEGKGFKTVDEGRRLLISAVSSGDAGLAMAQFLIDNGAQMDSEDQSLWAASLQQDNSKNMLNFVLNRASPHVDAIAGLFYSSSHTGAWGTAFSTLLDHGVAINFCVDNPLSKAVMSQDLTAVKVLLQYGARMDACPKNPITPNSSNVAAIREALAE